MTLYNEEDKNSDKSFVGIRLFVTGDLAFYAAALGKVNMSGFWCTWCKLCFAEWEKINHEAGICWTIGGIEQQRKDYQMGVRKKPLIIERVVSTQP